MGREKSLMAYPCLITQSCLAMGVQEVLGIDEMLKTINTTDLGLIKDTANPLARQSKQGVEMLAELYRQSDQEETSDVIKEGGQMKTTQTDAKGTFGAPPSVQFILPRLQGMPSSFMMISQAMWTEVIMRLGTLKAKVHNMEGSVKP